MEFYSGSKPLLISDNVKNTLNKLLHDKNQGITIKNPHDTLHRIYDDYISPNIGLIILVFAIIIFLAYRYQNKMETNTESYIRYPKETQDLNNTLTSKFVRPTFNPAYPVSTQISYAVYPSGSSKLDLPSQIYPKTLPNYGSQQITGPYTKGLDYPVPDNLLPIKSPLNLDTDFNKTSDEFGNFMVGQNRLAEMKNKSSLNKKNNEFLSMYSEKHNIKQHDDNFGTFDISKLDSFESDYIDPPYSTSIPGLF